MRIQKLLTLFFIALFVVGCSGKNDGLKPGGEATRIRVEPSEITLNFMQRDYSVELDCDGEWEASSDSGWLMPDNLSGGGSGYFRFRVLKNDTRSERTGMITIAAGTLQPVNIFVTQQPFITSLSVSSRHLEFLDNSGGSIVLTVHSNVDWTLTGGDSWCSPDITSGDAGQWYTASVTEVTVTASRHTGTETRTTSFILAGGGEEIEIEVSQYSSPEVIIDFGDSIFKRWCVSESDGGLDGNGDGEISLFEAAQATEIMVSGLGIRSLEGIQYFVNITELACAFNSLSKLDISYNTKLRQLHANQNILEELIIGENVNLQRIHCVANQLTSIDVAGCPALEALDFGGNKLTAIDTSRNPHLTYLAFEYNMIGTFDVSANPGLLSFGFTGNPVTSVDLSGNKSLKILGANETLLSEIDLSPCPDLRQLRISDCRLTRLDISGNLFLDLLFCDGNDRLDIIYVWEGFDINHYSAFVIPDHTRIVVK